MYEILLESSAERDLKKLPAEAFYRIVAEIKAMTNEPHPQVLANLLVQSITGVFVSVIIE